MEAKYFIGQQEQTKDRFEELLYFAAASDLRNNPLKYMVEYMSYDASPYMHEGLWLALEQKHYDFLYKNIMAGSDISIDGIPFKIAN